MNATRHEPGPSEVLGGRQGGMIALLVVAVAVAGAVGVTAALVVSLLIQVLRSPGCGIA